MTDVLVYDRDYQADQACGGCLRWHSNHRVFVDLVPGDRLWVVTSGRALRQEDQSAGYLVAMWPVQEVMANPDDDPAFPARKFGYRVTVNPAEAIRLEPPVCVDPVIRGEGYEKSIPIGRFLRGPRRLTEPRVRQLLALAGGDLAHQWLARKSNNKEYEVHEETV